MNFQNNNSFLSSSYTTISLLFLDAMLIALFISLEKSLAAGIARSNEIHFPANRCNVFKDTVSLDKMLSLSLMKDSFFSFGNKKASFSESQNIPKNLRHREGSNTHLFRFKKYPSLIKIWHTIYKLFRHAKMPMQFLSPNFARHSPNIRSSIYKKT